MDILTGIASPHEMLQLRRRARRCQSSWAQEQPVQGHGPWFHFIEEQAGLASLARAVNTRKLSEEPFFV